MRWIDARGFGFIKPDTGQPELFIHITAFKNRSRQPAVGDVIFYNVSVDRDGKTRAINAKIDRVSDDITKPAAWALTPLANIPLTQRTTPENKPHAKKANQPIFRSQAQRPKKKATGLPVLMVIVFGIGIAVFIKGQGANQQTVSKIVEVSLPKRKDTESQFECRGKEWCSEMTSCEEARFYLENCPNTKMDGDHDGVPCESQWCSW